MKTVVIFGAGNIGRGFIGQLMCEGGRACCFIDVNDTLVTALNRQTAYPLALVTTEGTERQSITSVRAVNGNDREAAIREIAEAEFCVTCVGAKALRFIIPNLADGVKRRIAQGGGVLQLLICENLMDADRYLHSLLSPVLTEEEMAYISLVETSVGRMVPLPDPTRLREEPLLVQAEPYNMLPFDRDAWQGDAPDIPGLIPVSPFRAMIERKLYIHNMGHAICAYLGMREGCRYIAEAIAVPEIRLIAHAAMQSSALALAKKHGIPLEPLILHTEDLLRRFQNRALGDTCERVGADIPRKLAPSDRLSGAALTVSENGGCPAYIAIGAAAAFCRYEGEQSFEELSGAADGAYRDMTLCFADMLRRGAPLSELIRHADALLQKNSGMLL